MKRLYDSAPATAWRRRRFYAGGLVMICLVCLGAYMPGIYPVIKPSGGDDTVAINSALTRASIVELSSGTFLLTNSIILNSGNRLSGSGPGTVLKKNSVYSHVLVNEAAYHPRTNSDSGITVSDLTIDCNENGTTTGTASLTANGQIHFDFVSELTLKNLTITNDSVLSPLYAIHLRYVTNAVLSHVDINIHKDGVHIGSGSRNVTISQSRLVTGDDAIAIMPADWPRVVIGLDDINGVIVENTTVGRIAGASMGGDISLLIGSWTNWVSGSNYQTGNVVINNARIYKMVNVFTNFGSVAPTHTTGDVTGADGIIWRWIQDGTNTTANIFHVRLENITMADTSVLYVRGDYPLYDQSIYPGTENTAVIHDLRVEGIGTDQPVAYRGSGTAAQFYPGGHFNVGPFNRYSHSYTLASDFYSAPHYTVEAPGINVGYSIGLGGDYDSSAPRYGTIFGSIAGRKENNTSGDYSGYLEFATRTNLSSLPTAVMRLTSAARVGIGTTNPAAKVDIAGDSSVSAVEVGLRFTDKASIASARNWLIGDVAAQYGNFGFLVSATNGASSPSTEAVTFASGGNVGIGATLPVDKLSVNGRIGVLGGNILGFYDSGNADYSYIVNRGTGAATQGLEYNSFGSGGHLFRTYSGGVVNALQILASGNVGIGTVAPSQKLHVVGSVSISTNLYVTNGIASFATNIVASANAAGWTNTVGINMAANVIGTSGTYVFYNRSGAGGSVVCGTSLFTNGITATGNTMSVPVNCGIQVVSGVGVTIVAYAQ